MNPFLNSCFPHSRFLSVSADFGCSRRNRSTNRKNTPGPEQSISRLANYSFRRQISPIQRQSTHKQHMSKEAKLELDGKVFTLPTVEGSEGEKAVDISSLRANTGYITLDDGYGNTGSCASKIAFIDGEKGILRYRGIPIEELAEKSTFIETAYLLIYGNLPNHAQLRTFSDLFTEYQFLHEDMR